MPLQLKEALSEAGLERLKLAPRERQSRTIHVHHHGERVIKPKNLPENLFVVKCHKGLAALKYWLQSRKYNTFIDSTDKNGKPMFGLLWDYHIGQFPSPKRSERGAIIVLDRSMVKDVALILLNAASQETEYGKQWVQAQRAIWLYGRDA